MFLLASLFFLIRYKDYWKEDIYVPEDEGNKLLKGIRGQRNFDSLIELGAEATPMIKSTGRRGQVAVYISYLALSAFSIIGAALFVSGGLILVGLILINADETKNLAQSVNIYWTLGHVVITRQLVSLSLTLGAFSALFLLAGQRADDRKLFMENVLVSLRRALLVYSVYCRAHDCAKEWTGIPVKSAPLALAPLAGRTIVAAASTDVWAACKRGFVRLLGHGDPKKEQLAEQRLEETRQQLAGADSEQARAALAERWAGRPSPP